MGQYANGIHVFYVPYKDNKEEVDAFDNWNAWNSRSGTRAQAEDQWDPGVTFKARRDFRLVTELDPRIPADWNFAASAHNVMYVIGHCESGSHTISASSAMPIFGEGNVDADDLAARIAGMIGNPGFPGGIKIYGCNSASGMMLRLSFAAQFATTLLGKHHYNSCAIYGYTSGVSNYQSTSSVNKPGDTEQMHRITNTPLGQVSDWASGLFSDAGRTLPRASTVRLKVAENGRMLV